MNKQRRLVVALCLGATGAAVIVACSFPDVTFGPSLDDGGNPDSPIVNTGDTSLPDGSLADAADSGSIVDPDGASHEASIYDAAGKIDASDCTTCDCDNDTFNNKDGGTCTGGPGGGFDCDDTDKSINQGADYVISTAWPSTIWSPAYDWNCDGVVTKQLPINTTCPGLGLGVNCASISGFSGDPACGASGNFITCKSAGLNLGCTVDTAKTVSKPQGCK